MFNLSIFKSIRIFLFFSLFISHLFSDDFKYEKIITNQNQTIHILEINPTKYFIKPTLAKKDTIGRETVQTIAKQNNAIAAINGGFFKIGTKLDGLPMGILKIDGKWISTPRKPRGSIAWNKAATKVVIDRLITSCLIESNNTSVEIDGINRPRKENEIILYLSSFHHTKCLNPPSLEIPINDYILSLEHKDPIETQLNNLFSFHIDVFALLNPSTNFDDLDHIVGGTPVLIKDGIKIQDFSPELTIETFLTKRHARCAIGIKSNGNWLFIIVDKNQSSSGMNMTELRDFIFNLGCESALNLDGGGSSTMVIDNIIVNEPEGDEDEDSKIRKVSNAILILNKL